VKRALKYALAAWRSGIVSVCGLTGREIESSQGIEKTIALKIVTRSIVHGLLVVIT
jgi:hypothetical protein